MKIWNTRRLALAAAAVALTAVVAHARPGQAAPAAASLIAFERHSGTGVGDIYVVRADGTGVRRVTRTANSFDPAWSPDGARIVFSSDRAHGAGAPELYVMNADGTRARRLTRSLHSQTEWYSNSAAAWSPDGATIVFVRLHVRGATSQADLWQVRADGTALRRLTRTKGTEAAPTFGPDGRTIYFERDGRLYAMVGGRVVRSLGRGTDPAFAARGSTLAFVRDGRVHVAANGATKAIATGTAPAWSPDATRIVFAGDGGLYAVRPDGRALVRLTRGRDVQPAYSPPARTGDPRG